MPTLELNQNELLKMAQNNKVSTEYWAKIMTDSKPSRRFFKEQVAGFQDHRYGVEIGVKIAVTVTLGVGLFLCTPATLLYGAALTLSLSSALFANINLNKHEISIPEAEAVKIEKFNAQKWEEFRNKWTNEAQNHGLSEKQKALNINMTRAGIALVVGFAAFTAIASGMAIPLAISSILFSGSLFYRHIDDPVPFVEKEELPSLTM